MLNFKLQSTYEIYNRSNRESIALNGWDGWDITFLLRHVRILDPILKTYVWHIWNITLNFDEIQQATMSLFMSRYSRKYSQYYGDI